MGNISILVDILTFNLMGYGQPTRPRFYSSWHHTFRIHVAAKCYDCADKCVNLYMQKANGKSQCRIHRLYPLLSALGICTHIHVYIFVRHKRTLIGLRDQQFTPEVVLIEGRSWYSPLTMCNESEEMLLVSLSMLLLQIMTYMLLGNLVLTWAA